MTDGKQAANPPENGPETAAAAAGAPGESQRLARAIARSGLCSRRDAEDWIRAGRVCVNGALVTGPALDVGPDDRVEVDGAPLAPPEPARLWRYHKPRGLVTTARDEKNRPTVFAALPREMPRVVSVGRLDVNSEGLLLLTNDGDLARRLELPRNGWIRRYRVRVRGRVDSARLESLQQGVTVEGVHYGPVEAVLERQQGSNAWIQMTLREGRNREIRRIMGHIGYTVNRLIRVAYGPFRLDSLPAGMVMEAPQSEIRKLLGLHRKSAWAKPAARRKPLRRPRPAGGGR